MKRPAKSGLSVELQIDELLLHGFGPGERFAVADALESELAELLAQPGFRRSLISSMDLSTLDGGEFRVPSGSKPQHIGAQVGLLVYQHLVAQPEGQNKTVERAQGEGSQTGNKQGN
jgi:hypothetical protein